MDQALLVRYMMQQMRSLLRFVHAIPLGLGNPFLMSHKQIHERLVVHLKQWKAEERPVYECTQMMILHRKHVSLTMLSIPDDIEKRLGKS